MGAYDQNREWYDQDSSLLYDIDPLTSKASLLTKYEKKYFLIHGTGDDNVHFRHSALWEQRLIEAGMTEKLSRKLIGLQVWNTSYSFTQIKNMDLTNLVVTCSSE